MVYFVKKSIRIPMWMYVLGILVFVIGAGRFFLRQAKTAFPSVQGTVSVVSASVTPTPMPFAEMTIPYLRSRRYGSALGDRQEITASATYTSYLTSYTSDGLRINALLTIPRGQTPAGGWPAVVFVHGYIPPAQYRTLENYADYVDYLARNGFVVLKIDLRGHGDSEGVAGGGYYAGDYVIDTLHAIAALASSGFVNPASIGLWGHSMAGNVTLRAMAAKPDTPALVIWAGAVYTYLDQQELGINDASFQPNRNPSIISRRRQLTDKVGTPSATSDFWKAVAPTNYVGDMKGAIEVHHAIDDAVVDIAYSRGLMQILDTTSIPHQLYEYPTGGHNISGSSFTSAMGRTVDFYKKYLLKNN